ncbi:hypothetical protein N7G274_000292 [Stereocaulon virgatum]|uniref:Uncharacterized protein n=1 Tax=Stereocaulon virgatum TaxID=373712 RepID=A0ABR4AU99_9LECA
MIMYFHTEGKIDLGAKGKSHSSRQLASPVVLSRVLCQHSAQHLAIIRRRTQSAQHVMAQARHRETISQATGDSLSSIDIVTLLQGVRPYAVKLRDIVLQCQTLPFPTMLAPVLGLPPPTESNRPESTQIPKIPSLATRRAACTHLSMERLYGLYKCNICQCPSKFGWLYSCTQDDGLPATFAAIPTSEASKLRHDHISGYYASTSDMTETLGPKPKLFQMPTPQLSPWIEKAIKEGHYTPEQVKVLRAQKQKVVDIAFSAVERFNNAQAKTSKPSGKKDNALQSVDANLHLACPVINEVQNPSTIDASILFAEPKVHMFPYCKYRACQFCRPTFRDRTWQCFDEIFANDSPINLDEIEAEGRPLANPAIMRTIGLREPLPRRQPQLRAVDSRDIYTTNEAGQIVLKKNSYRETPDVSDSADVADEKVESEIKGFRESWKRAIKGMLTNPRSSIGSNFKRMSRNSSEGTNAEVDASGLTEMSTYMDDDLLTEASSIPLPANDGIEKLTADAEEGDIGGVAMTEEAAETGTADIIMSV